MNVSIITLSVCWQNRFSRPDRLKFAKIVGVISSCSVFVKRIYTFPAFCFWAFGKLHHSVLSFLVLKLPPLLCEGTCRSNFSLLPNPRIRKGFGGKKVTDALFLAYQVWSTKSCSIFNYVCYTYYFSFSRVLLQVSQEYWNSGLLFCYLPCLLLSSYG